MYLLGNHKVWRNIYSNNLRIQLKCKSRCKSRRHLTSNAGYSSDGTIPWSYYFTPNVSLEVFSSLRDRIEVPCMVYTSVLRLLTLRKLQRLRVRTRTFCPRMDERLLPIFEESTSNNRYSQLNVLILVVNNNNKLLSHAVDSIIFEISVPDYPSITVEITFLG